MNGDSQPRQVLEFPMHEGPGSLSRREREFHRHRLEILEAAETVFAEKGYVSATMEEIAQKAEFSVGTLYKFFRKKADLYAAVILEKIDAMAGLIYQEMAAGTSPLQRLEICFRIRMELFWRYPRFFRLLYNDLRAVVPNSRAGFIPQVLRRYEAFLLELEKLFTEGVAQRQFRDLDPSTLSRGFEAVIGAYLERMARLESPVRPREEEAQLLALFLHGAALPEKNGEGT